MTGQTEGEGPEAIVTLVEARVLSLHGLLHHRAPQHFLVLALQGEDGVDEQGERLGRLLGQTLERGRLRLLADEVLVVEKLVAVVDEKLRGRALHPEAEHLLVVLFQLRYERRKIRIAR